MWVGVLRYGVYVKLIFSDIKHDLSRTKWIPLDFFFFRFISAATTEFVFPFERALCIKSRNVLFVSCIDRENEYVSLTCPIFGFYKKAERILQRQHDKLYKLVA